MDTRNVNRRTFIAVSTTTVASLVVGCSEKGAVKRSPILDAAAHTTAAKHGKVRNQTCARTPRDIQGPYWRTGIPIRTNFAIYNHPGERLKLSGIVRDGMCRPIPNAVIEMWHAHPTIIPAEALAPKDSVDYDLESPAFRYYGQFATDHTGAYTMSTMKPGWYLNGPAFRPSHIHVKIYVEGAERLTTQLYFAGDPFIDADPWASRAPERTIALKAVGNRHLSGQVDFTV